MTLGTKMAQADRPDQRGGPQAPNGGDHRHMMPDTLSDLPVLDRHMEGIGKALDLAGNTHTVADVLGAIGRGEAQFWTNGDALIVTELKQYPQFRELHFWIATGEMDAVRRLSDDVMRWGREMGCSRASLVGRRGWERALGPEWQRSLSVMTRRI